MEIKIVTVVKEPSDHTILEYAKLLRSIIGPQQFLLFLQGEEIKHKVLGVGGLFETSYQLSEPAKGILVEKEKIKKGL